MAPNFSKYLTRTNTFSAAGAASAILILYAARKRRTYAKITRSKKPQIEDEIKYVISDKKQENCKNNGNIKAQVDREFFKQLKQLLAIVIPGWATSETGLLVLVALTLISRSVCDLWMINNGTKIESAIVSMDKHLFKRRLFNFIIAMPLIAIINNILKYSIGELKIHLRTNMTHRLYEDYMKNFTYYRLSNLDNRINNVDQLLTTDIDKFCECISDLYCNTAKPLLDIGIYVYKLSSTLGGSTPALMLGYLLVSGSVLTYLRRPVARLTSNEQKLEGEFRYINSRLITNSEEIAFYNGNNREKSTILTSYNKLLQHLRKFLKFRVLMGIIDNLIAKYFASIVGFWAVSLPFLSYTNNLSKNKQNERSRLYYTYGRMLVKLAEAIGRLVLAGRELTRLAGFTQRITQLRYVLNDLNNNKYERTMVQNSNNLQINGKFIFRNNIIKFNRVPLITPNGEVLIKELTFEIPSGRNVLICGPNGCGKSSLFRILGELWPIFNGEITKPPRGKLFYIPQRPYMTLGTLRDQLIYPHSYAEAKRRGCNDNLLIEYLQRVELKYLLERDINGLDAIADWLDVLSGGEKQRIAMARLFYHQPQFAILDECTSAVSVDIEGSIYNYCRQVGITLLTVTHRKSLWQHHDYVLKIDGKGDYIYEPIDNVKEQFGS